MSIARPAVSVMRRPLQNEIKKHIIIAFGLAAVSGIAWKLAVSDVRKKNYQEFYRTYDDARHFRRMAAAGVFDSVKPDSAVPQWITDYEKEVDAAIATLNKSKK